MLRTGAELEAKWDESIKEAPIDCLKEGGGVPATEAPSQLGLK